MKTTAQIRRLRDHLIRLAAHPITDAVQAERFEYAADLLNFVLEESPVQAEADTLAAELDLLMMPDRN